MFFGEKRDVLLLPEPTEPGVKTWPKAHPQRGAKRVFTHGAVLAVVALALACGLLGFCCGNVGGAELYWRLPSGAPFP